MAAAHRDEVKSHVAERACQLIRRKPTLTKPLRIFSIGCGDGTFDIKVLQTITNQFPELKIHYIGSDIDENYCQQTRERLNTLKNVEVEVLVLDFQQIDDPKVEILPCDLILAVHVFYYMIDIKKALSDVQRLRTQDGMMLVCTYI